MLLDTRAQRLFQCPLRIRRPGIVGVVRIEFFSIMRVAALTATLVRTAAPEPAAGPDRRSRTWSDQRADHPAYREPRSIDEPEADKPSALSARQLGFDLTIWR
ncbi:hypothetical protein [Burkholderia pyrrocinia]|uniref:hypothetical protein n=1 Tax=Burkholderia pyrrocinia TaxID=60550 RepID=UPI00158A69A2|nr:hypothetical protein [Burkholderia pyrrocinia]